MAFKARDGKEFSMSSRMRAHNVHMDAKGGQEKAPSAILDAPESEQEPDGDEQDPHAVVAEHGGAHSVHVMHGEGQHTVESEHPDGHKHHSSHAAGKAAHEHAMCLSGNCDHGGEMGGESEDQGKDY